MSQVEVTNEYPLVSIVCITYNQEQYVRETLEGFVMQQCDFPFEIIIHDDASTDSTADIIREYTAKYPGLFTAILRAENQYSQGVDFINPLYDMGRGKYIATCEGDDYWIDPLKLQKQVEYMEAHPNCGLTYTQAREYQNTLGKFANTIGSDVRAFEELLRKNNIPSLTVMFRKAAYANYVEQIKPFTHGWKMFDYPLWLYIAAHTKIHFIDQITAVYRILDNSASNHEAPEKTLAFEKSTSEIREFFAIGFSPESLPALKERSVRVLFEWACRADDKEFQRQLRRDAKQLKTKKKHLIRTLGCFPKLYIRTIDGIRGAKR